jgi:hypothetical protein
MIWYMEGRSGLQQAGAWRLWWMGVLATLLLCVLALVLLSGLGTETKRITSGVGLLVGGLAIVGSFVYRYRRSTGRRRRAWRLFAVAGALAAVSNLILVLFPAGNGRGQLLSNIGLCAGLLVGVAGLATFPLARRRATDVTRMVLDGVVISGSIVVAAGVTMFPAVLQHTDVAAVVALAVPLADIELATLATLLFLRADRNDRPALGLVAGGFACCAVSDCAYAAFIGSDKYVLGSIVSLGWITGYALIALAIRNPSTGTVSHGERPIET